MPDRPCLNNSLLKALGLARPLRPERVLQFGGGAFLRGFVDWMIDRLNRSGRFDGSIVIVQSTGQGRGEELNRQDGLYTLLTRGIDRGRTVDDAEVITSVSRTIDARARWPDVLAAARSPDLRIVVSNTTEAGIVLRPQDRPTDAPPASFPGKLAAVLLERFNAFNGDPAKGLVVLPCELIDDNGRVLREIILDLAGRWELPKPFGEWLRQANIFCNTLVDRIVPGPPGDAERESILDRLGYDDALVDVAEPFAFWAIEADESVAAELPFEQVGLTVVWTPDIAPYRRRKVRILNGAHTMTAAAAFLAGRDTVRQCIEDPIIGRYVRRGLFDEILPVSDVPQPEAKAFAEAVLERFANPFVQHQLLSITLNTSSKFRVRVLPSLRGFVDRFGTVPPILGFSLAATIVFYRGCEIRDGALVGSRRNGEAYAVRDDLPVLERFARYWSEPPSGSARTSVDLEWTSRVLSDQRIWGEDLTAIVPLVPAVAEHVGEILRFGAGEALERAVLQRGITSP